MELLFFNHRARSSFFFPPFHFMEKKRSWWVLDDNKRPSNCVWNRESAQQRANKRRRKRMNLSLSFSEESSKDAIIEGQKNIRKKETWRLKRLNWTNVYEDKFKGVLRHQSVSVKGRKEKEPETVGFGMRGMRNNRLRRRLYTKT